MSWSDSQSMDSDDLRSLGMAPTPWLMPLPASAVVSTAMSFVHTGQLSPISNGMDPPSTAGESSASNSSASASASPIDHHPAHATSVLSHTEAWAMEYAESNHLADTVSGDDSHGDIPWEQGSDDVLIAPKLEPLDDELCMDELKEAPLTPVAASDRHTTPAQPRAKRPRGRPRKHPRTPKVAANKITKGRSKTGCLTCRKRKKKCDEAKPRCKLSLSTP